MKEHDVDREKYADLVKKVNIVQINLMKINAEKHSPVDESGTIDVTVNHRPSLREVLEDGFIIDFESTISASNNEDEKLFDINIKYELLYSLEGGIDEEEYDDVIDSFAYRNVPVNIWPYIRELVSEMTVRMGFPPLVLKPLKVFSI